MGSKGIAGCILAGAVFLAVIGYFIREDAHNEIIYRGRADRENGRPMQSNPYTDPGSRELWRKGWREAKEISE